ncbi:MAG: hypothetical protein ACLUFF_03500, partial [Acutalibacteraceae bacterium]
HRAVCAAFGSGAKAFGRINKNKINEEKKKNRGITCFFLFRLHIHRGNMERSERNEHVAAIYCFTGP